MGGRGRGKRLRDLLFGLELRDPGSEGEGSTPCTKEMEVEAVGVEAVSCHVLLIVVEVVLDLQQTAHMTQMMAQDMTQIRTSRLGPLASRCSTCQAPLAA
jgi:hypothetical protein